MNIKDSLVALDRHKKFITSDIDLNQARRMLLESLPKDITNDPQAQALLKRLREEGLVFYFAGLDFKDKSKDAMVNVPLFDKFSEYELVDNDIKLLKEITHSKTIAEVFTTFLNQYRPIVDEIFVNLNASLGDLKGVEMMKEERIVRFLKILFSCLEKSSCPLDKDEKCLRLEAWKDVSKKIMEKIIDQLPAKLVDVDFAPVNEWGQCAVKIKYEKRE